LPHCSSSVRRLSSKHKLRTSYAQATHKRRRPVALRDGLASASSTACLRVVAETASQSVGQSASPSVRIASVNLNTGEGPNKRGRRIRRGQEKSGT
jgi:hypothetical protein